MTTTPITKVSPGLLSAGAARRRTSSYTLAANGVRTVNQLCARPASRSGSTKPTVCKHWGALHPDPGARRGRTSPGYKVRQLSDALAVAETTRGILIHSASVGNRVGAMLAARVGLGNGKLREHKSLQLGLQAGEMTTLQLRRIRVFWPEFRLRD
jgi:hypothetical protein